MPDIEDRLPPIFKGSRVRPAKPPPSIPNTGNLDTSSDDNVDPGPLRVPPEVLFRRQGRVNELVDHLNAALSACQSITVEFAKHVEPIMQMAWLEPSDVYSSICKWLDDLPDLLLHPDVYLHAEQVLGDHLTAMLATTDPYLDQSTCSASTTGAQAPRDPNVVRQPAIPKHPRLVDDALQDEQDLQFLMSKAKVRFDGPPCFPEISNFPSGATRLRDSSFFSRDAADMETSKASLNSNRPLIPSMYGCSVSILWSNPCWVIFLTMVLLGSGIPRPLRAGS